MSDVRRVMISLIKTFKEKPNLPAIGAANTFDKQSVVVIKRDFLYSSIP